MSEDLKKSVVGTANQMVDETRHEIKLLVRRISDDAWAAALSRGTEDLMRRFPQDGTNRLDREIIKSALWSDMDHKVLSAVIARELVSRLVKMLADGAGVHLDLRFAGSETSKGGALSFLRVTAKISDLMTIYRWNVARVDPRHPPVDPKTPEKLNEWDWGLYLDSIVRSVPPGEAHGVSNYSRIFGEMSNDGFIVKSQLIALRHLDVFYQGTVAGEATRH